MSEKREVTCPKCGHVWVARYTQPYDFERCPECRHGYTGLAYHHGRAAKERQ